MHCPNCGNKLKPKDEFCEVCGAMLGSTAPATFENYKQNRSETNNAFHSKTDLKTCSNCRAVNPPGEDYCQNCGAELKNGLNSKKTENGAVAISPVSAVAAKTLEHISPDLKGRASIDCPNCDNQVALNDKFCRKCGYNFVDFDNPAPRGVSSAQLNTRSLQKKLNIDVGSAIGADGRYAITQVIGRGGMGAVFLAEDKQLKRKVVIKAVLQSDDPTDTAQAIKEREFLAAVKHPNIVSIYDFVTVGGDGYIVMEYVNGKTLYQLMEEQNAPFDPATAIRYTIGILPAFAYLHKLNLVYCDFKPQNVMVEQLRDGTNQFKLIDLGTVIRYEKDPEAVYGTDGFYAPEAVKSPSPETDLYTISRALAYMVSWMDLGVPKFGMPPAEHYKTFRDFPALYRFLYKGTNPVPARRYPSAEAMASQLDGVLRVVAGGQPGTPVNSNMFAVTGNLGSNTGTLGGIGMVHLDTKDKAFDLLRQGDAALKQGYNTQALSFYNQALGQNPYSSDAHLRIAELLIEDEKFSEALAQITKVQRLDPNNWKIAWYTGRLLESQNNLKSAREQYHELIQDLPGELPPLLAMARVEAKLGNLKDAADLYSIVVRADPSNTEALFGASEAYLQQRDFEAAAVALLTVSDSSARYLDAQLRICDIFLHKMPNTSMKELSEVSKALRHLEQRDTNSPQFLLAKAEFYHKAWEICATQNLRGSLVLPFNEPDEPEKAGSASQRKLGKLAEESYREYLNRNPRDPNREQIVRQKFKVTPWRFI